jgi:hypothetical protein
VNEEMEARALGRGEVLLLAQRSMRRREYELRHADEVRGGPDAALLATVGRGRGRAARCWASPPPTGSSRCRSWSSP